jgi:uncharacterized protein (DUF1800 family)
MNLTLPLFAAAVLGGAPFISSGPLRATRAWDRDRAAHLLRRAGFGGTPEQVAALEKLGRARAVDSLLDFGKAKDDRAAPPAVERRAPPSPQTHPGAGEEELQRLRAERIREEARQVQTVVEWWIGRMVSTPRPLEEKLVLFWHGHFTSGFREVKSSWAMRRQNELFRQMGAGNFRDLVVAVTYDPAMILYLNTQQNRKGQPNENYARELMELFTLGTGHYGEGDIREAARAFTGISIDPLAESGRMRPRLHDDGEKTVLGVRGRLGPEEVIDLLLLQPAAAEHLARRLWSFFASDTPEPAVVKALATVLRENRYELRPALRAMFMSDAFYGERSRFTHIKSPVELLVGTLRALEIEPVDTEAMNFALRAMGQQLMQPPNVKGWDGGAAWISTSTLYNRYNLVGRFIEGTDDPPSRRRRERMRQAMRASAGEEGAMMGPEDGWRGQPAYDPRPVIEREGLDSVEAVVDHYVDRLLQRPIAPERRDVLIGAVRSAAEAGPEGGAAGPPGAEAVRALLHLITSMPEYQLS